MVSPDPDEKVRQAERTEAVFPEGVPPDACYLSHVGRCAPGKRSSGAGRVPSLSRPGQPLWPNPGVLGRSEYGLEIVTEIAYLVYSSACPLTKSVFSSISSRTCT